MVDPLLVAGGAVAAYALLRPKVVPSPPPEAPPEVKDIAVQRELDARNALRDATEAEKEEGAKAVAKDVVNGLSPGEIAGLRDLLQKGEIEKVRKELTPTVSHQGARAVSQGTVVPKEAVPMLHRIEIPVGIYKPPKISAEQEAQAKAIVDNLKKEGRCFLQSYLAKTLPRDFHQRQFAIKHMLETGWAKSRKMQLYGGGGRTGFKFTYENLYCPPGVEPAKAPVRPPVPTPSAEAAQKTREILKRNECYLLVDPTVIRHMAYVPGAERRRAEERELIEKNLKEKGWEVKIVSDGIAGVPVFEKRYICPPGTVPPGWKKPAPPPKKLSRAVRTVVARAKPPELVLRRIADLRAKRRCVKAMLLPKFFPDAVVRRVAVEHMLKTGWKKTKQPEILEGKRKKKVKVPVKHVTVYCPPS